jgi:hypothetical protein
MDVTVGYAVGYVLSWAILLGIVGAPSLLVALQIDGWARGQQRARWPWILAASPLLVLLAGLWTWFVVYPVMANMLRLFA